MKKILFFLLVMIGIIAKAQLPIYVPQSAAVTPYWPHGGFKSLKIPVFQDSAHATAAAGIDSIGLIFKELLTSKVYVRDTCASGGHQWDLITGSGGGGSFDSLASQGGGFRTDGFNVGKYVQRKDSAANEAFGYVTQASRQKLSDSLQAVGAAARALKKNIADSLANQSFGYVTQASRQKLADSLLLVLLHRWDTAAGTPGSYVTWASRKKLADSITGIFDTTKIRYYGTGDTLLRAGGLQLLFALVRDSGNVHIVVNADSSLTFYGSGGAGTDSGFNVLRASLAAQGVPILKGTAGAVRNILWDTLANNPAAIVTQASRKKLADSLAALIVGGGAGAYYPPLDSVLWKGPISARNMQVAGIKSTGQDTLTATTYSEGYDRVIVQDTATGAGNGKLYRRKMQTIDMTGATDNSQPYYSNSAGNFKLSVPSIDKRLDTFTVANIPIYLDANPHNTGWYNLGSQRNTQAFIARLFDTSVSSTTQFRLMTAANSMGEHPDLIHQNFVKYMSARGRSAGPGYISAGNNHTYVTVSGGTTSWTERSLLSGTPGKGIDGYDAITTGTGTDSIIFSVGTQNKGFDYTWADTVSIFWYGQTGGGTFKVDVDGIGGGSYVTINTSSAIGPQQTKIATTTGFSHVVAIIPVSEGTTHSIFCGVNEYRKVGGWIYEHVAKGASVVSDWTTLNASDWETWVSFIKPSAVWMDWVVTSAGVMDSLAYANGVRTMMGRVHTVDTTTDIVLYGSTPLSLTTTGATAFNNLPSYNRVMKRLALDSNVAFWDPSCIYGKTIFSSVFRGMQSTDSIHRTSAGSYAEVGMQLAGLGMLPMYLPPTQATIYNSDNNVLSPRTLNFNKQFLHLDSLTFLRFSGSTGNPVFSMDFTNSLALALSTGGIKVTTDFPLVSSQPITSNYAGTTIGNFNASLPNTNGAAAFITSAGGTSCTSCYLMYGQATAGSWILNLENLNAGAGYAIMQAKTGGTGNPVSQYVTGGTTWDAGADHSASNAYKIGTGGATFTNPAITIPTSLKVGIGSITSPTAALHLPAGTASANTAPLKLTSGTNLTTPENGAIEYDGTHYYGTAGGSRLQLDNTGGGGSPPFADNTAIAMNNSDNTKLAKLDLSGITTATTRTYGLPDFNGTFAMTNHAQTWSGAQDMTGAAVTATTQSAGDNTTKVATTAYVDRAASGATYTSSTSSISNATSLSINQASYTVSGTIVHVVIDGSYTATSGGNYVTFSVSLPSGKNSGSSANRMAGFGFNREEPSGAARTLGQVAVNNSASTAAITLVAGPTNGATNSFVISFDYSL